MLSRGLLRELSDMSVSVGKVTRRERARRWRELLVRHGWPQGRAWLAAWWVVGFRGKVTIWRS
jgi:hypothetical protein